MFVNKVLRRLKLIIRKAYHKIVPAKPVTKHSAEEWQSFAQEGEFEFHVGDTWRTSNDFVNQSRRLFEHFGFSAQGYAGKTVVDLGAGSKLRSKFFEKAKLVVIEPLADRFRDSIDWCDLNDANQVYSYPAEQKIEELEGQADLLVSINVLDHCYNFETIIANIASYLAPDGIAFLSFDKHEVADEMHPIHVTEEICEAIFSQAGLEIQKFSTGAGSILKTYGHGPYCLNYWLGKRRA